MVFDKKNRKVYFSALEEGEPFLYMTTDSTSSLGMVINEIFWEDEDGTQRNINAVDLINGATFWIDGSDTVERITVKIVEV